MKKEVALAIIEADNNLRFVDDSLFSTIEDGVKVISEAYISSLHNKGFTIVPIEPTEEMLYNAVGDSETLQLVAKGIYSAMIKSV